MTAKKPVAASRPDDGDPDWWHDDRRRAFEIYPRHLTDVLLKLPEPARSELRDVIEGTLMPLASFRDNHYRIPRSKADTDEHTFTRDDFDDIISELQALVTLLEDDEPK